MGGHTKKIVDELCDYLGYDFESPMCRELHDHVLDCDSCKEYIESVKITVKICQDAHKVEPVPDTVKSRLLQMLKDRDADSSR